MARSDPAPPADLPTQVEETVRSIAEIHDDRLSRVGTIQKLANRTTSILAHPLAVVLITVLMLLWIIGNVVAPLVGLDPVDALPAPELNLFGTIGAFIVTLLILTTQRHEQEADRKREELILHVAMLSEQKIAKVIALLEEQRRDNPLLASRADDEAETMATPVDPRSSLERIEAAGLGQSGSTGAETP